MSNEIERWQAYLDDELPPQQRRALEQEWVDMPDKKQAFEDFQAEQQQLHDILSPLKEDAQSFDVHAQFARLQPHLTGGDTHETSSVWQWWTGGTLVATFAAAMLFFVLPNTTTQLIDAGTAPSKQWRIKGFSIQMLHQHKGQPHSTHTTNRTVLHPGDFVQFAFTTSESMHAMIVSLDEEGRCSRYIPLEHKESVWLQPGKGSLPQGEAIELDDSKGQERFFVLVSPKMFTFAEVKQTILQAFQKNNKRLKGLALSHRDWRVFQSVLITKQPKRRP